MSKNATPEELGSTTIPPGLARFVRQQAWPKVVKVGDDPALDAAVEAYKAIDRETGSSPTPEPVQDLSRGPGNTSAYVAPGAVPEARIGATAADQGKVELGMVDVPQALAEGSRTRETIETRVLRGPERPGPETAGGTKRPPRRWLAAALLAAGVLLSVRAATKGSESRFIPAPATAEPETPAPGPTGATLAPDAVSARSSVAATTTAAATAPKSALAARKVKAKPRGAPEDPDADAAAPATPVKTAEPVMTAAPLVTATPAAPPGAAPRSTASSGAFDKPNYD